MANPLQENSVKKYLWGKHAITAAIWVAIAFLFDQATKWLLVATFDLDEAGTWPVTSFFSLTMAWNEGVSYGLFAEHRQIFLIMLSLAICAMLWTWVAEAQTRLKAASLGLIIGGALGNVFDRLWHGAVADFMHFHVGAWNWYIFNIADVAITLGVLALLYDSFTNKGAKHTP